MEPVGSPVDAFLAAAADPTARRSAAAALAESLGGDDLMLFAVDPDLEILLPAPGFPQTLRGASTWRDFLRDCTAAGDLAGTVQAEESAIPVRGIAVPGSVAVLLGPRAHAADLSSLRPSLPVLGALFRQERRADAAEVRTSAAQEAADRAATLTRTVRTMHATLQAALADAETARRQARTHAQEAEALAEELRIQTAHLEDKTIELQALNEQLAERSGEAETARAAAESADRAKSEFLANMSHELRTPINAIIGYADILDMEISGDLTAEQRHHIDRVRASSRHLLTLINDVLDLAKIEAGHMTVQHSKWTVRSVIDDAIALLALLAADHNVEIIDDCPGSDLAYFGDQDRVRQILANLLSNAVKFTDEGGMITIRCGSRNDSVLEANVEGDGPWTYIEVEDTGLGMSPAEAAVVFRPFVQARTGLTRAHRGTGLGLTISRQLARLMGGDLTLRTEPGVGSCLTLLLPGSAARSGAIDDSIRVGAT